VLDDPDFTLIGTIDRIDRKADGDVIVYDYKSGLAPSDKEVKLFDPQLPLEAVMAEAGTIAGVDPARVASAGYISLGLSGKDRSFDIAGTEFAPEVTLAEFRALIRGYFDPSRGYTSRRAVKDTRFEGDFDQLARFGEWDESDPPVPVDLP